MQNVIQLHNCIVIQPKKGSFCCFCIAHLLSNYKHSTHMYLNTFCVQCCYSTETTVCVKWKLSYNFRPSVCSFRKWGLIQWDTRLWLPLYVLVVGCLLSPWSPAIMLITPTSSPLLHSHPSLLFFLSCFGRKWSQSSSRTTWNNSELGGSFLLPPPLQAQASWSASALNCVSSRLCALSKGRGATLNFVRVCTCIYALCVAASCSDICFGASVPLKNERGWKNEQKLLWKTDLKLVGWVLLFLFFFLFFFFFLVSRM